MRAPAPPPGPASLPREVPPLVADPARVHGFATDLLAASAQVDDLGSFAAGAARLPDWVGDASAAYHAGLRRTGGRAEAMSLAMREAAHRVQAHADALATLLTRRDHLLAERAVLVRLAGEVAAGADPGPVGERSARFHADLAAWEQDVAAAEAAMVDDFSRALTWPQVARRWQGVVDPADAALAALPARGAPPTEVHAWWLGLSVAARRAVVAASPGSIGNRPGVPAAARHAANTVALERDIADWSGVAPAERTTQQQLRLDNALAARDAVDRVSERVDPVTGEALAATLLLYDPDAFGGDGRVAVGVGDLDRADHVAVVVPGMGTDAGSASAQADRAVTLHESTRFLHGGSVATLAWIGYDAPDNLTGDHDVLGAVREQHAVRGGERLADALDGLRASRPEEPAHLTVVGNSYGSTTTAHGATDAGLPVDDIVLTGSPGAGDGTDHAADLGVGAGHVWVASSSHDPVAGLADEGWVGGGTLAGAGLGDDPAEDDFGARRVQAESVDRGDAGPFGDHTAYFDHDSESLANISHVVAGEYAEVRLAGHRHDPWYGPPVDPEAHRAPTTVTTRRP